MIDSVGNKIGILQQTLRTQGVRGALVVGKGNLRLNLPAGRQGVAVSKVAPLVTETSSDFTRNLHRNLTEFIAKRFGINITDILCDPEGKGSLISANPTFMDRVRNSGGDLEVLGHTVVFEMESDDSGKVYFLRKANNIWAVTNSPRIALPKSEIKLGIMICFNSITNFMTLEVFFEGERSEEDLAKKEIENVGVKLSFIRDSIWGKEVTLKVDDSRVKSIEYISNNQGAAPPYLSVTPGEENIFTFSIPSQYLNEFPRMRKIGQLLLEYRDGTTRGMDVILDDFSRK